MRRRSFSNYRLIQKKSIFESLFRIEKPLRTLQDSTASVQSLSASAGHNALQLETKKNNIFVEISCEKFCMRMGHFPLLSGTTEHSITCTTDHFSTDCKTT